MSIVPLEHTQGVLLARGHLGPLQSHDIVLPQNMEVCIFVCDSAIIRVCRSPPFGQSRQYRLGCDPEELGQTQNRIPRSYFVLNSTDFFVPVEITRRVSKVIRGGYETHNFVEPRLGPSVGVFHLVDVPRVVRQDAFRYSFTSSERHTIR